MIITEKLRSMLLSDDVEMVLLAEKIIEGHWNFVFDTRGGRRSISFPAGASIRFVAHRLKVELQVRS